MGLDIKQHGVGIAPCRCNTSFQAGQGFFIQASTMLFRPFFQARMNGWRNIFECYTFHNGTISQP